jgi:quaternary ammonium compound-resistance protein SugE
MEQKWLYLFIGGLLEIGWTIGLKKMDDHKNLTWTIVFYVSIIASFYFLQLALKEIPIGTAYAIYTSIGIVGTVLVGMIFFKEPTNWERFVFIIMIIGGVAGLKMTATN